MRGPKAGCRALMAHFGIGTLTAVTILAEFGDAGRFASSREAVRYAGMDITVHQSDQRRAPRPPSRQGPPALRRALFEAAQSAARAGSPDPDRDYYRQAAELLGANRACLSVGRKLLKRSWQRPAAMQLWQLDVVFGPTLVDTTTASCARRGL